MKLIVVGFPKYWDDKELFDLFKPYAPVSAKVIKPGHRGIVEIPSQADFKRAIKEKHLTYLHGLAGRLVVKQESKNPSVQSSAHSQPKPKRNQVQRRDSSSQQRTQAGRGGYQSHRDTFPYGFARDKNFKKQIPPTHARLLSDRCDIAFEVEWKSLSPVAANPCTDESQNQCFPENNQNEYAGFNKRWLCIDGQLAISPFTVKSAIASGFANLLGGCYRVTSQKKGHGKLKEGQYPYGGSYKRYRVSMDNQSKPGILKKITSKPGDDFYSVTIQPVKEFFYDSKTIPKGITLIIGGTYYATTRENRHKFFIGELSNTKTKTHTEKLRYFGPYKFGRNCELSGGKLGKNHYHRFYREIDREISGHIPVENFLSEQDMHEIVYLGSFKRVQNRIDPRTEGTPWYQDLSSLEDQVDSWVYYEIFDGQVRHIGKNFLFKTLFKHEDTVPPGKELCKNMETICPRCAMFGMTDDGSNDKRASLGYRGRFKASALLNDKTLNKIATNGKVPVLTNNSIRYIDVKLQQLIHDEKTICSQFLMPLQLEPKPNKQDVDGYYDFQTGKLKGRKLYRHGYQKVASLDEIKKVIRQLDNDPKIPHKLRNYAMVCKKDLVFKGTLGAENANTEEIAALLILLHHKLSGHGFKVGLAKSRGLGSMVSSIHKIWIRKSDTYSWMSVDLQNMDTEKVLKCVEKFLPGVTKKVMTLKKVNDFERAINNINGSPGRFLEWPAVGPGYWHTAKKTGLVP